MGKKLAALVTAFVVVLGGLTGASFASAPPAAAAVTFVDVSGDPNRSTCSAFATEISWMASQGISQGYASGSNVEYRPYLPVARDAMAAFLYRHAKSPAFTPPERSPFLDVPVHHPFYKEITWLASTGISKGWEAPQGFEFRPGVAITRDAMATFLYRYAKSPAYSAPAQPVFADVPRSNAFYAEISWLNTRGVSTGWTTPSGTREFRPYGQVTRDAMAAFLYRFSNPGIAPSALSCDPVDSWKATRTGIGPLTIGIGWQAMDAALGAGWTTALVCGDVNARTNARGWLVESRKTSARKDTVVVYPPTASRTPIGPTTPAGVRIGMSTAAISALPGVTKVGTTGFYREWDGSIPISYDIKDGYVASIRVNHNPGVDEYRMICWFE